MTNIFKVAFSATFMTIVALLGAMSSSAQNQEALYSLVVSQENRSLEAPMIDWRRGDLLPRRVSGVKFCGLQSAAESPKEMVLSFVSQNQEVFAGLIGSSMKYDRTIDSPNGSVVWFRQFVGPYRFLQGNYKFQFDSDQCLVNFAGLELELTRFDGLFWAFNPRYCHAKNKTGLST